MRIEDRQADDDERDAGARNRQNGIYDDAFEGSFQRMRERKEAQDGAGRNLKQLSQRVAQRDDGHLRRHPFLPSQRLRHDPASDGHA